MNTKRTCGECTFCCKTHGVFEFQKLPGTWCVHCEINKGCKIYSKRPKSCRLFECAWLMGFGLPEHRPDKTNIVPDIREIRCFGLVLFLWAASVEVLDSPFAKRQTRLNLEVGKPVMHVPVLGSPKLYLPKGECSAGLAFRLGEEHTTRRDVDVEVVSFLEGRF